MTKDMREAQTLTQFIRMVRASWTLLALAAVFAIAVFFSLFSLHKGSNGLEILALMVLGLAGGAAVRVFVRDSLVAVAFIVLVVAESLLCQLSAPWSVLWPVLIPANAIGVMVGNVVRLGLREVRRSR